MSWAMGFFRNAQVTKVLPCLADPSKTRVVVEFEDDVSELLPYLNAVLPRAIYNHTERLLNFDQGNVMITIYPRQMALARVEDVEHTWRVVEELRRLCAETEANREKIKPSFEQRHRPRALDIYRLLPGAQDKRYCRECGEPTCLVFATKLVAEKLNVTACKPLFTEPYADRRQMLLELLQAAGYCVPVE
jgi:ArsR family metal-binding transcriptional regulator